MKKFTAFVFLLMFLPFQLLQAQQTISISATADVSVPADKIAFQITVNAEAETPQKAYELHKKREKVLVNQLKKFNISEKDIRHEPISINRISDRRYSNSEKDLIRTRQNVVITFTDFDLYEKIQLTLVENSFDEFSGSFLSSKDETARDDALRKALQAAREKAQIIADQTGVEISGIKHINYSHHQRPVMIQMDAASSPRSGGMLQFEQTLEISATVSVTYQFE